MSKLFNCIFVFLIGCQTEAFQNIKFAHKLKSIIQSQTSTVRSSGTNVVNDAIINKKLSFVQDELRPYAMKLHTRDQSPREGQQPAQKPFTEWEVGLGDYLHFLVDSLHVYETFDKIINSNPVYEKLRNTGLERTEALRYDIKWITEVYDTKLKIPVCGKGGNDYGNLLQELSVKSPPKFICHFYNHYFAHTAGGRMIGKKLSDKLLEGKTLKFYEWEGDVKVLLDTVRHNIDAMAETWSPEEKFACLEETGETFRQGGSLMVYMKPPSAH
jgi:heme oxygenase